MKRFLGILLCSIFLGVGAAAACECAHAPQIEGAKARKQIRHFLYVKNLQGDKKQVYKQYGFACDRLRVDDGLAGITETWTYHRQGLEFTFDDQDRLIETHSIPAEDRSVSYF